MMIILHVLLMTILQLNFSPPRQYTSTRVLIKLQNLWIREKDELSPLLKTKPLGVVTRLREYQGVDPHFDTIARQYHDIVKKLENMQWTIHQVEMDLKRFPDHPSTT
ncbi:hypothetical protein OROMI_019689 [Orobanche minor]